MVFCLGLVPSSLQLFAVFSVVLSMFLKVSYLVKEVQELCSSMDPKDRGQKY